MGEAPLSPTTIREMVKKQKRVNFDAQVAVVVSHLNRSLKKAEVNGQQIELTCLIQVEKTVFLQSALALFRNIGWQTNYTAVAADEKWKPYLEYEVTLWSGQ